MVRLISSGIAEFLLTHPVWDVTKVCDIILNFPVFLLTHPVWDVTDMPRCFLVLYIIFLLTHPVWDVTQ